MKLLFEVDAAHASRTGIALRASMAIAIVAATAHDRVIAFSAAAFIAVIAFYGNRRVKGQKFERE